MSRKMVLFQTNKGDEQKFKDITNKIRPEYFIRYQANQQARVPRVEGTWDYLLATGGHGNFQFGKPTQLNGMRAKQARAWAIDVPSKLSFRALVLDTCFSSAFIPDLVHMLELGGSIVCAHGSGEGWTEGLLNNARDGLTVGQALGMTIDGTVDLGLQYSSVSLFVRVPVGKPKLYTMNYANPRKQGLTARSNMAMDHDTIKELRELDRYLEASGIEIELVNKQRLKDLVENHLDMNIS